jgi:hypothetical protein
MGFERYGAGSTGSCGGNTEPARMQDGGDRTKRGGISAGKDQDRRCGWLMDDGAWGKPPRLEVPGGCISWQRAKQHAASGVLQSTRSGDHFSSAATENKHAGQSA